MRHLDVAVASLRLALVAWVSSGAVAGCASCSEGRVGDTSTPRDFREGIDLEFLQRHVAVLAADALEGRATSSAGLQAGAAHIALTMREIGLEPLEAGVEYRQTFDCGGAEPSSNVIGAIRGRDVQFRDEAIVISAHYDHIGRDHIGRDHIGRDHIGVSSEVTEVGQDLIYNGANDNATGVAAMLAIARAFAVAPEEPRRSLVFIAFCGEELGLRGSKYYVKHPAWPLESTVAVVNLEMLGHTLPTQPLDVWITGMELSNLGERFVRASVGTGVRFIPSTAVGPEEGGAFARSDNYPFAEQGVVAHTFSTGRIDALYHSLDDEIEHIDFDRMESLVEAIAIGVERLAEDVPTPAFVEPAVVEPAFIEPWVERPSSTDGAAHDP